MKSFVVDTGPLAALLDRRDSHHGWATEAARRIKAPFLTCDAVLTETLFLIGNDAKPRRQMRDWLDSGVVKLVYSAGTESPLLLDLMDRYASVPMSFADACLVRMSELFPDSTVFTTDSDFHIYRRNKRKTIPLLCPV